MQRILSIVGIVLLLACFALGSSARENSSGCYSMTSQSSPGAPEIEITTIAATVPHAEEVAILGDFAFVACSDHPSLYVLNITDPRNPTIVTTLDLPDVALKLELSGDYLYVGCSHYGLVVVNVTNPAIPVRVAEVRTMQNCRDIKVSGDYAYIAGGSSGFIVLSIVDPTNPIELGRCGVHHYAYWISISGDYAYVSDEAYGLDVIDVSNPGNPHIVAGYQPPFSYGGHNAVFGDYVFFGCRYNDSWLLDVVVLDIHDPTHPVVAGMLDIPGTACDIRVSGNRLYVMEDLNGEAYLLVIDISDPIHPVLLTRRDVMCSNGMGVLTLFGNYGFYGNGLDNGLHVMKFMELLQTPYLFGSNSAISDARDVVASGDYAFVANVYHPGLYVMDIGDLENPTVAAVFDFPGEGSGGILALHGNYLFASNVHDGLLVLDVTQPTTPVIVGQVGNMFNCRDIAVAGDNLYVAGGFSGLIVYDITDPRAPIELGRCGVPDYIYQISVDGDYVYASDQTYGLLVFDVSDSSNPHIVGTYDEPGIFKGQHLVYGDYIFWYFNEGGGGTYVTVVLDMSNPANPVPVGRIAPGFFPQAAFGDYLYAYGAAGLQEIIDITDPVHPFVLTGADAAFGQTANLTPFGEYALVGAGTGGGGFKVLKVFCPRENPVATLLQGFSASFKRSFVEIDWTLSNIDEDATFGVLRAKEPGSLFEELPTPGIERDGLSFTFKDVSCEPGMTYRYRVEYANGSDRQTLFETDAISTPTLPLTLYQNAPNPFNPSTAIRYYLPERQRVVLDIFDVAGRRVTRLIDEEEAAGIHAVSWSGISEQQQSVGSGIYFYRLSAGGTKITKKMIMLR